MSPSYSTQWETLWITCVGLEVQKSENDFALSPFNEQNFLFKKNANSYHYETLGNYGK